MNLHLVSYNCTALYKSNSLLIIRNITYVAWHTNGSLNMLDKSNFLKKISDVISVPSHGFSKSLKKTKDN
jgi:hypothetical protein